MWTGGEAVTAEDAGQRAAGSFWAESGPQWNTTTDGSFEEALGTKKATRELQVGKRETARGASPSEGSDLGGKGLRCAQTTKHRENFRLERPRA